MTNSVWVVYVRHLASHQMVTWYLLTKAIAVDPLKYAYGLVVFYCVVMRSAFLSERIELT